MNCLQVLNLIFAALRSSEVLKLKGAHILLIFGPRDLKCENNMYIYRMSWPENLYPSIEFDLSPLLQGEVGLIILKMSCIIPFCLRV